MDFGDATDDGEVPLNPTPGRGYGVEPTCRGRPGSTGGDRFGSVSDESGGTVSVGAPEWGSTEVDQVGSAASGY